MADKVYKTSEKQRARARAYYYAHKEERKAYGQDYYQTHKVEMAAYQRTRLMERRASDRVYRESHKAEKRNFDRTYHALKKGATGEFVNEIEIYDRDGWLCQLCHETVNQQLVWPHPMVASCDHIIPISKGGVHRSSNLQLAHLECNRIKGNEHFRQPKEGGIMEKTLVENMGIVYEIEKKDDEDVVITCQKHRDIRWVQSAEFVQKMIDKGVFKEIGEGA